MNIVLAVAASYLIGSIPFGLIIGKLAKGIDIRDFGSGNIGASNVLRTLGPVFGTLVFVFDTAKGFAAVELCYALGLAPWWVVLGSLMSVFGHTFSMFLGFKGGKGVATSLGVIIGLDPVIAAIAFGIWMIVTAVTRYISLASIISTVSVPLMMIFWRDRNVAVAYQVLAGTAALTILIKHRTNMRRLIKGEETRIGEKVDIGGNEEDRASE